MPRPGARELKPRRTALPLLTKGMMLPSYLTTQRLLPASKKEQEMKR